MTNDKNKKTNSDKTKMKKSAVSGSCKPCMPVERNGTNKEKPASTKDPSVNEISNVNSCYKKCASQSVQKESSSTSSEVPKTTDKPFEPTTATGSCYAKCGPPSVSSTSNGSTAITGKPDQVELQQTQRVDSDGRSCELKSLSITNPFIEKMDEDILYHIALGNKSHDLPNMFGDVKFVVMGSTPKRMEQFAYFMANQLKYELPPGTILNDISKNSHRYAMFKVGPILSVSHGMGTPSIGILLHELIKLMSHAGVKDPTFLRIGTCGGFNKKVGTVVVSNKVVNDFMEPFYELAILGKKVRFPANLDQTVVNEILSSSEPEDKSEIIAGATYCTDNFYEGSGRADGAICEFSEQEGLNYYKELQQSGVVNVEMESLAFAALTCRAGIKSAIVTVILSDRLETDQVKQSEDKQSKEILDEWQSRPQRLVANYIKKKLSPNDLPGTTLSSISTAKVPNSSTTTGTTGGTGSSTSTSAVESATSIIPTQTTRSCSTTASNTTRCQSCGGTGMSSDGSSNKPDLSTSTMPSMVPNVCKSSQGFDKENIHSSTGGTSTITPTISTSSATPVAPMTCKSNKGTGIETQSSIGSSTTKPTDKAYSTSASLTPCKPCEGMSKITEDNSTTNKPVDLTSTVSSDSKKCNTCQGIGKDEHDNNSPNPTSSYFSGTSSIPKCTGSNFNPGSSTVQPTTAPCTSCLGSGKTNNSNLAMQSTASTTRLPDMVMCKCCGGAGVVPNSKLNDPTISTMKPFVAPGSSQTDSVCKPCLKLSNENGQAASSLPTAPTAGKLCTPGGSTTIPSSSGSTTSAPSHLGTNGTRTSTAIPASTTSTLKSGSSVCKPCLGINPSTTVPGSTTSAPVVVSGSTTSMPATESQMTTAASSLKETTLGMSSTSTQGPTNVCKPCVGSTTIGTIEGASTLPKSKPIIEGVCKPCGERTNSSTTAGTSTTAPNSTTTTSQSSFSTNKSSILNTTTSTTIKPGIGSSTTESQSGRSMEGLEQNEGSTTFGTSPSTSTCKPGSNPPTSQPVFQTGSVCKPCEGSTTSNTTDVTTSTPSSTSTTIRSSFSIEALCKRNGSNHTQGTTSGTSTCKPGNNPPTTQYGLDKSYGSGSSTGRPSDSTTIIPGITTTAPNVNPFGVCKPCGGGSVLETTKGTTTTPASGFGGLSGKNDNHKTTAGYEILSSTREPLVTTAPDVTKSTTCQPTVNYSTTKTNLDAESNETSTTTTNATAEPKRPKCVPYTCYTADKSDTTPLPTTPKAYLAKDFDSSSNSTISNDSWRSCYQKCSKVSSSEGRTLSTSKPLVFQTPEQDDLKDVPPALGPCCRPSDTVEFREVPDAKGQGCTLCKEQKDLNGGQVERESSVERRPSIGQIKTESSAEIRPSVSQIETESSTERPPSVGQIKAEPSRDRRPSMGQIKTESIPEKRSSFDSTNPLKNNRMVDSESSRQNNGVTRGPNASNDSTSGSCGLGQSTKPQDITTPRSTDPKTVGGLCSGNIDDSPDEPCVARVKSKSQANSRDKTDSKCTNRSSLENVDKRLDETRDGSKKSETNGNDKTDPKSDAPGQLVGNLQGCPISIGGPCIFRKDNGQPQNSSTLKSDVNSCTTTSTPKPSPDTPDTSTIRAMPTFVTPTPQSSKGIICYSKFTNNNGVLVSSSVNKEANKYDESLSPCAACKKFQESKTRTTGSTPSDSHPEIIKCPHKLKRLKDECQGYD